MAAGMVKPRPGKLGGVMMEVKVASLQILQEQPGVWWKPLGEDGDLGIAKGLPAKMLERFGSFLLEKIKDPLGKILDETGQFSMIG